MIFLLEIVASVLAFVYRYEIESTVRQELIEGIKKSYPKPGSGEEEGLEKGWAAVQSKVGCQHVENLFNAFFLTSERLCVCNYL